MSRMPRALTDFAWRIGRSIDERLTLFRDLQRQTHLPASVRRRFARAIWRRPSAIEPWMVFSLFAPLDRPVQAIDAGANIGDFPAELLAIHPMATIRCFEPFPASAQAIRARFAGDDRVAVVEAALSDRDGASVFNLAGQSTLHSLQVYSSDSIEDRGDEARPVSTISVETRRLEPFLEALDPANGLVMLKIDVQGEEARLLEGAGSALSKVDICRVECALASTFDAQPPTLTACATILARHGLHPIAFQMPGRFDFTHPPERDVWFVRAEQTARVHFRNYPAPLDHPSDL